MKISSFRFLDRFFQCLAKTGLSQTVLTLQQQGVTIFKYPLTIELISPHRNAAGVFQATLNAPPGICSMQSSQGLASWTDLSFVTNNLGNTLFPIRPPALPTTNSIAPVCSPHNYNNQPSTRKHQR